jgi:hypothetical protein
MLTPARPNAAQLAPFCTAGLELVDIDKAVHIGGYARGSTVSNDHRSYCTSEPYVRAERLFRTAMMCIFSA